MHIHLLQVVKQRGVRSNKDTNGGYGTVNDLGSGLIAQGLKMLKNRTMNFPEILPAYVHAILRKGGHEVTYGENAVDPRADVVLIQTSIINFNAELEWSGRLRSENPKVRLGFIGGMAAGNPEKYAACGDFVITGEVENALLNGEIGDFNGIVDGGVVADLDSLPFPDWSHVSKWRDRYGFIHSLEGRFLPMLSSRGCPMSCAYYCTYPLTQGAKFRARSPENMIEEVAYLQKNYGMTTVLFRDPIFSLKMDRVAEFCELILQHNLKFSWLCETHPRLLNADLIALMARSGCIAVKLGIESANLEVMKKSHRASADLSYQGEIVRLLEEHGIDVLAFYMIGYFDDDENSILQTIDYAIHLNTYGAQFAVATPYPGTPWYAALSANPGEFRLDENLENYTQYRLVYDHPRLSFRQIEKLKSLAYQRYYLRLSYLRKHLLRLK